MDRKSLAGLFVCNLVLFSFGNGFLPLMPLYAQQLGADSAMAGYYVALAYLCLAAGTFFGGRLSDARGNRRTLLASAGLFLVPLAWLLGRVGTLLLLTIVTGLQWLLCGVCLAVVAAIAGREAGAGKRGTVFGILGTTISLGSLAGGLTVGRMVDAWGYPPMFLVMAGVTFLIPVAALLAVREQAAAPGRSETAESTGRAVPLITGTFVLLLAAEVLTMLSNAEGNMGRSLEMSAASFGGTAITMTAAVGGIVSLPLPFLLGWLSDKVGRRLIMITSPLAGAACLLLLLASRSLWQFSVVAVLNSIMAVSISVGPAMVADIVRRERVGTGISLFQSSVWIGMILGFSFSGIAFQRLGMQAGLELGAISTLLAVPLFLLVRNVKSVPPESAV